jgi:hypothetical protein
LEAGGDKAQLDPDASVDNAHLLDWATTRVKGRDEACKLASDVAHQRGDLLSAVEFLNQGIALRPASPAYHRDIAALYRKLFQYDAAQEHLAVAKSFAPNWSSIHSISGLVLRDLLKIDAAVAAQEKAIALNTDLTSLCRPYYELSECYWLLGRFKEGWQALAHSCQLSGATDNVLSSHTLPIWTGWKSRQPVAVICDRGIGDIIQFGRFISCLARHSPGVTVVSRPELHPILSQMEGVTGIAGRPGDKMTVGAYCLLSSLPGIAGTDMTNIPAQHRYVAATPLKAAEWKQRLDRHSSLDRLKIGLVWAGSPDHNSDFKRSMRLDDFSPFGNLQDVSLFSLQVGSRAIRPADGAWPDWIVDFGNDIAPSFEDTMGLLANLDLVVTVDTAVAHLAGAMGVKTFVMLAFSPDGRWMLDRSDTPWYPSLRLFRQPRWQDWAPVVQSVVGEVKHMTKMRA